MTCHLRKLLFIVMFVFIMPFTTHAKQLIPMGQSIGIQLKLPFVYIAHDVLLPNGEWLKQGEMVTAIDGKKLSKLTTLQQLNQSVELTIENGKQDRKLKLAADELTNLLPFLKDETDGIGTLTFIDPESQEYGALGHQIIDATLKKPPKFKEGSIFMASIAQVKKSTPGQPGYKISVVDKSYKRLGTIANNDLYGIFGAWEQDLQHSVQRPIEIIRAQDIKLGKAQLLTAIEGNDVTAFDIEITKLDGPLLEFIVTDKMLLAKTGGILQGMSGSPIIQNESFVGAVTHMFVEKPSKGAAISIIEMLKKTPN